MMSDPNAGAGFQGQAVRLFASSLGAVPRAAHDGKNSLPGPGGPSLDDNLIIHGDNLEALKALLPRYAGKVNVIYIDPPYNTGNEGWVYNDNVNSPLLKGWLGKSVDAEDLERHDKWLCMMWPKTQLLIELLSPSGILLVSIDGHEQHYLVSILMELFGGECFHKTLVWKRRFNVDSRNVSQISEDHEYILVAGRDVVFRGAEKDLSKYENPDGDLRGPWMSDNLTGLADAKARPNLHYDLVNPDTGIKYPPHPQRGWAVASNTMARLIADGRILAIPA